MGTRVKTLPGLAFGIGAALVAAPARGDIEIGVFGGGKFYSEDGALGRAQIRDDPDSAFQHSGLFGLRLGCVPTPRLAVEAEVAVSPTSTRGPMRDPRGEIIPNTQAQVAVAPLRAHLLVNLLTGRFRPFLLVGGGGHLGLPLSPGVIQGDAVGAIHAGAGMTVGIRDSWGLRLDGRFVAPQGLSSALVAEGELFLSAWGRFGKKPAPPPPPPPPPADAPPADAPPAPGEPPPS